MRVPVKNMPKLKLVDLLRRRKMSLKQLLDEFGITTFESLNIRCERMGVVTPSEEEFKAAFPNKPVNSPQEGVVVVEALPVIDDITGREIDPDAPVAPEVKVITGSLNVSLAGRLFDEAPPAVPVSEPTDNSQKKFRKKKEASQGD